MSTERHASNRGRRGRAIRMVMGAFELECDGGLLKWGEAKTVGMKEFKLWWSGNRSVHLHVSNEDGGM